MEKLNQPRQTAGEAKQKKTKLHFIKPQQSQIFDGTVGEQQQFVHANAIMKKLVKVLNLLLLLLAMTFRNIKPLKVQISSCCTVKAAAGQCKPSISKNSDKRIEFAVMEIREHLVEIKGEGKMPYQQGFVVICPASDSWIYAALPSIPTKVEGSRMQGAPPSACL